MTTMKELNKEYRKMIVATNKLIGVRENVLDFSEVFMGLVFEKDLEEICQISLCYDYTAKLEKAIEEIHQTSLRYDNAAKHGSLKRMKGLEVQVDNRTSRLAALLARKGIGLFEFRKEKIYYLLDTGDAIGAGTAIERAYCVKKYKEIFEQIALEKFDLN